MNKDKKMVVLGMGYLMEYLYPCYEECFKDNLKDSVIAVTADEKDLERKRERCAFPVLLNENMKALSLLEPNYILVAPPPSIAPSLIQNDLVPYFNSLRKTGKRLPVIFAFPPKPAGRYYMEKLGEDVHVVNILPNMVSQIAGERLHGEGLTYLTYPANSSWTEEERHFVSDFFAPLGGTVEVKPEHVNQMLAGTVTVHNISEIIFTITDAVNKNNGQISYKDIASAMRHYHRAKRGLVNESYPSSDKVFDPYFYAMLKKICFHWYEGIKRYYLSVGMSEELTHKILSSLLDLHLQIHQREERNEIEAKGAKHATKGGVLAKGCEMFEKLVTTDLNKVFSSYPSIKISDEWCAWFEDTSFLITSIVAEHGNKLASGQSGVKYDVNNHAVLFGIIAKNVVESGLPNYDSTIRLAVMEYAKQRGSRMRQRCDYFGDEPNMLAYKAYCEWLPENESFDTATIEMRPVHKTEVYACPWSGIWAVNGFMKYARYYCDHADYNLVKGFNDDLVLEMGSTLAHGQKACTFTWCGADMSDENVAWINTRREELKSKITFGWEYHTSHLYHSVVDTLINVYGNSAKLLISKIREEYANRFGVESLAVLDGYKNMDFKIAVLNG